MNKQINKQKQWNTEINKQTNKKLKTHTCTHTQGNSSDIFPRIETFVLKQEKKTNKKQKNKQTHIVQATQVTQTHE